MSHAFSSLLSLLLSLSLAGSFGPGVAASCSGNEPLPTQVNYPTASRRGIRQEKKELLWCLSLSRPFSFFLSFIHSFILSARPANLGQTDGLCDEHWTRHAPSLQVIIQAARAAAPPSTPPAFCRWKKIPAMSQRLAMLLLGSLGLVFFFFFFFHLGGKPPNGPTHILLSLPSSSTTITITTAFPLFYHTYVRRHMLRATVVRQHRPESR